MSAADYPTAPTAFPVTPSSPSVPVSVRTDRPASIGWWLGENEARIRRSFVSGYRRSSDALSAWIRRTGARARHLREEKPLPLLGVISATSFIAGISLAVMRSRKS